MRVYMIRNPETGEWLVTKKHICRWTYKQHHGFVTNSKSVIYGQMRIAKIHTQSLLEIVEFEATEIQ